MASNLTEEELESQIELLRLYFNIKQWYGKHELVGYRYFISAIKSSYNGLPAHKITHQLSKIYEKPTATISNTLKAYLDKSIRTRRIRYEQLMGVVTGPTLFNPKVASIIEAMAKWLHEYRAYEDNGIIIWERRDSSGIDNRTNLLKEIIKIVRMIDPQIEGIKIYPQKQGFVYIYYMDRPLEKIYVGSSSDYDLIIDVLMACMTSWHQASIEDIKGRGLL